WRDRRDDDAERNRTNRIGRELYRALTGRTRDPPGKAQHGVSRGLAVGVDQRGNDHREQELEEQPPDAADLENEPAGERARIGREVGGQLLRTRVSHLAPACGQPNPGIPSTQEGGAGRERAVSDLVHSGIRSVFSTMVATAK